VRIGSTNRLADPELIEELRRYASGEAYDLTFCHCRRSQLSAMR
jgi:hypothetical protein